MLSELFGSFADTYFQGIGASPIQVRYRGVVITPTPIVSDEGVQAAGEASRLVQSEAFKTVTISIPKDVLLSNLALGTPPGVNFEMSKATSANSPWELSFDGGTWQQYRTSGDPEFEVFRVKLLLVRVG
jgi:hypothetical protein